MRNTQKQAHSAQASGEIATLSDEYQAATLPVNTMGDLSTIGKGIAQSGMFGRCTEGKGMVIAATIYQEGISIMEFKRRFHVTDDGQITMRSDRMLAELQSRGGTCKWVKFDVNEARAVFSYRENENLEMSFTIEEAKKAGLVRSGGAWEKHPADMLRARLISKAVRMICPEAVAGVYTPEEMGDISTDQGVLREPVKASGGGKWVEAELVVEAEEVVGDCDKCPIPGNLYSVAWSEMDTDTLRAALQLTNPEMTDEHVEAVKGEIEKREHDAEGGAE